MKGSGLTAAVAAALLAPCEASALNKIPVPTVSVELAQDGFSPKPTPPPGGLSLFKRADDGDNKGRTSVLVAPDNTCGFVSARPGAYYTCAGLDYSCVFFTAYSTFNGYVGCCDSTNCGVRLGCVDYEDYYSSSACDDGCQQDVYTLKCINSDMPYCNTVSFSSKVYDYWCNSLSISTAQSATTAYSGSDRSFSPLRLDDSSSSFSITGESTAAVGPTTTGVEPSATSGTSSGDSSSDSNGNGKSKSGGSSTPVGPIVGGVVGGVAAIGLGALGLWLFFRNKKKKNAAAAAQASPAQGYPPMQQGPPPPGMAPSPGQPPYQQPQQPQGYYDPKFMAAAGQQQQYGQYPPQQQQGQQPGGFYAMGNTPPPQSTGSPATVYTNPHDPSSPSAVYPSGVSTAQSPSQTTPPQQGFIAEAPSRPEETHRGGVHELM